MHALVLRQRAEQRAGGRGDGRVRRREALVERRHADEAVNVGGILRRVGECGEREKGAPARVIVLIR